MNISNPLTHLSKHRLDKKGVSLQYFGCAPLTRSPSNGQTLVFLPCCWRRSRSLYLKLKPHEVDSFFCCLALCRNQGSKANKQLGVRSPFKTIIKMDTMEVFGKSVVAVPTNVIYLSSILGQDGPNPVHKCDWKCENENVCGNMFRCKVTGLTHICDKNCNQRIVYDNNSSLCRVSRQVFPLTAAEVQAVKGVRRKLEEESSSPPERCAFKRRRSGQFHPSPFERSFSTVAPICSQVGDVMDIN